MITIKWFVGIFETENGPRIGISEYYDENDLKDEKVLCRGLTEKEADIKCKEKVKELGIEEFNNRYDIDVRF